MQNCIPDKFAFITLCDFFSLIKDIDQNDFSTRKTETDFTKRFA